MNPTTTDRNEQAVTGEPLRLDFRQVSRLEIVAGDAADDRYRTTLEEMAEACRQHEDFSTWRVQFEEFLRDLYQWCSEREDLIDGCFLALGEGGLKAFITTTGTKYDFDLGDRITDLELKLLRVYPMCPVEILQMPAASPDALQSFFSPEASLQIYGKRDAAPVEG